MPSIFDWLAVRWPGYVTAGNLGRRPVPDRCSDARVLDPGTAIIADCASPRFRTLVREWHDRGLAEDLAEAVHQRDLERAAQPPVIEVTVTTPPEGIPRLELERAVAAKVAEVTGPRRMLTATRRAGKRFNDLRQEDAPPAGDGSWWPPANPGLAVPVSEDDTPTVELPAVAEVHVP